MTPSIDSNDNFYYIIFQLAIKYFGTSLCLGHRVGWGGDGSGYPEMAVSWPFSGVQHSSWFF